MGLWGERGGDAKVVNFESRRNLNDVRWNDSATPEGATAAPEGYIRDFRNLCRSRLSLDDVGLLAFFS